MKAAAIYAPGPPEALQYVDLPDPVCAEGELLMRVHVVSLEGGDTLNRTRPLPHGAPHVVGYHAAGEVVEVGEGVSGFAVGDRVSAFGFHGSHAELRVVQPQHAFRVPAGMDMVDAAVVPIAFGTVHEALFTACDLQHGETVLVPAAASGLGVAAIQMARCAGASVIAAASSTDKLHRIAHLSPDAVIDTSATSVADAVKRITHGRGVDVVLDGVGGVMLQQAIRSLAPRGRIALVGAAGREGMTVDLSSLQRGAQSLHGVFLGPDLGTPRVRRIIEDCLRAVADGRYTTVIDSRFPLSQAAQAHAHIESRRAVGRVVLITDAYRPSPARA
jgi:NADPH2:quinone reductase